MPHYDRPDTAVKVSPDLVPAEAAKPLPFAALPHAIASDTRLSPTERLVIAALLYWALDEDRCTMADWRIADYVGVTREAVQHCYKRLQKFGHVRFEKVKPTQRNMTGRVVVLCFREDPSYLPLPPDRRAPRGQTRPDPVPAEGVKSTSHPVRRRRLTPCEAHFTPGVKPAPHKEESLVVGEGVENRGGEAAGAPAPGDPTPTAPPMAAQTNERDISLTSNENENEPAEPMSLERRRTIERLLELGGPVAQQARRHLAQDDKARARLPAGGTMMTSPKPIKRMGPGELKARIATVLRNSEASQETLAMLSEVGPGCDPHHIDRCVWKLCRELDGDGHSQGFFIQTLNEVRSGRRSAESVAHAYTRACGPTVRNRGAAFVAALKDQ